MLRRWMRWWFVLCACMVTAVALGQNYPARPVRIISPFAAGGSNDVVARLIAVPLGDALGQQFIVENRPGAGGVIGTELAAKAAPDGYTLAMVSVATLAITPSLRKVAYDPLKDFTPIGLLATSPYIVVVHPTVPVKTIGALVALARARPGQVEFGSGGVGTPGHLAGAMLNTLTGINMVHVPYKAGNLALNDLLGGHISVTFSNTITSVQLIKAGKVRGLAATSAKRIPAFPDLPTVAESGVPGYDFSLWLGLAAPASVPAAIIQRLSEPLVQALRSVDLRRKMATQSVDALSSTPDEFAAKIKSEIVAYARVVMASGARAE